MLLFEDSFHYSVVSCVQLRLPSSMELSQLFPADVMSENFEKTLELNVF